MIYVDGGFTTNKKAPPKDINVCWDRAGVDLIKLNYEHPVFLELSYNNKKQKDKYSCEFFRADWEEKSSAKPFLEYFQQYNGTTKGIYEEHMQLFEKIFENFFPKKNGRSKTIEKKRLAFTKSRLDLQT